MAQKVLLTDQAVTRLQLASEGSYKVYDTEVAGFFVKVGKRQRTYMARGEFWRDGLREFESTTKVGAAEEITARDARKRAREIIGGIAKGTKPGETAKTRVGEITLRAAWDVTKKRTSSERGAVSAPSRAIRIIWTSIWPTGLIGRSPGLDVIPRWSPSSMISYRRRPVPTLPMAACGRCALSTITPRRAIWICLAIPSLQSTGMKKFAGTPAWARAN